MRKLFFSLLGLMLGIILPSCQKTIALDPKVTENPPEIMATRVVFKWSVDYPGKISSMVEISKNEEMNDAARYGSDAETTDGSFVADATGLDDNATFFYRYVVWNPSLNYVTKVKSFNTLLLTESVVTTSAVTDITIGSAVCEGEVTNEGNDEVTERGVCWSTQPNPETKDSHVSNGSGLGSFKVDLTGLSEGTTYHVRAYAINNKGTSYGNEVVFTTLVASAPKVTTTSVTHIHETYAICGGEVTDDGNLETERGICWSESHNPEITDSHISNGNGIGSFTVTVSGLTEASTYYVRAYAVNEKGVGYGSELCFITHGDGNHNGHDFVDLDLPSGTLWATCNVGADAPTDFGDYFAWGETTTKETYNWDNYKYCNGGMDKLTKYCCDASNGDAGFTDTLTILQSSDDAATANWGEGWCIPSKAQWQELIDETESVMETQNGVEGRLFTASNGKTLFIPGAGHLTGDDNQMNNEYGSYWSRSLRTDGSKTYFAWYFYFYWIYLNHYYLNSDHRCYGMSIRPVRSVMPNEKQ